MTLGENVKKYRTMNNLTQNELAEKLQEVGIDIKLSAISNWENNRALPDVKTVYELCKIFGIDGNTMMGFDKKNKNIFNFNNKKTVSIAKTIDTLSEKKINEISNYVDYITNKKD